MNRLLGRSILIVGGTGGIGLASARRFLREGARVVVTGLTVAEVGDARPQLDAPGLVAAIVADVGDEASIEEAVRIAGDRLGGRIDILFHVAGLSGRRHGDGPLHEATAEGWDAVLLANARGTFFANRAVVRRMLGQPIDEHGLRGTILNTGSVLAGSPSPEFFDTVGYAASKGAVRALTMASASRYAADKIRFNLIAPALIETPMSARAVNDPRIRAFLATKQPIAGGPGLAEDCAEAALYLCEPASRFLTGVELNVDGGWSVSEGQVPRP